MAEKVFWDTWAFIELADRRSRYHKLAKDVFGNLSQQRAELVTTDAVLTEVGNAFSKHHSRHLALQQLRFVECRVELRMGRLIRIDDLLWQAGWELYEQRPDKYWGHTDCMSFVVMRELKITKAFTADIHFEQAGFECLVKT
jgi:uncharacterized protein